MKRHESEDLPMPPTSQRESPIVQIALAAGVASIVLPLLFAMRVGSTIVTTPRVEEAAATHGIRADRSAAMTASAPGVSTGTRGLAGAADRLTAPGKTPSSLRPEDASRPPNEQELALLLLLDAGIRHW